MKPPHWIKVAEIVYCKIDNEIVECVVVDNWFGLNVSPVGSHKEYRFKFWQYGDTWASTKGELK